MKVIAGLIYKAKHGCIYDDDQPQYNCYCPVKTGNFNLIDCWICTEDGNLHPGVDCVPVPVDPKDFGKIVGKLDNI